MKKTNQTAKVSSVKYTQQIADAIDNYRTQNLLTWEAFFQKAKMKGQRSTILYWEKTGRISFNAIRKFKAMGLDLLPYLK